MASNEDFNASIALNNVGVELLTRGYYQEANVAFQDSVDIMRSHISYNPQSTSMRRGTESWDPMSSNEVDAKLINVSESLAKSFLEARMKRQNKSDRPQAVLRVTVVSNQPPRSVDGDENSSSHDSGNANAEADSVAYAELAALHGCPSSIETYAVRIEVTPIDSKLDVGTGFPDKVGLETSIILHNLGVAKRCLGLRALSSTDQTFYFDISARAFRLCYSMLAVTRGGAGCGNTTAKNKEKGFFDQQYQAGYAFMEDNQDRTYFLGMLSIATLALQSWVQLSRECGKVKEAKKLYRRLGQLRQEIRDLRAPHPALANET